ncbi:MAG: GDP-L-fucose synthase [Desulfobulbaceae bacterium]|nr:GDP-L-fucose synthase [Desulfobulbaceae bacterium]
MDKLKNTIFIAGHKGLVGSALHRVAEKNGYSDILIRDRTQLNLLDPIEVENFFAQHKPNWVFLAAAKVGGIYANSTYPVDFILDNLKIQNNIIESSFRHGVDKLLFLGSSCIFPREAPQPIKEEYLLTSSLEKTNEPYAIAKIAGIKLCNAFNRQYGTDYLCVMPSNLYGINDNFHPENAHVIPMLLRRFHEAKQNGHSTVTVWGTGTPKREFLFSDDLAEACFFLMENCSADQVGEFINIGTGKDIPISELVEHIRNTVGFQGKIVYDTNKPDGTMRKCMDVSRINGLGWRHHTELKDGLRVAYNDFLNNQNVRK